MKCIISCEHASNRVPANFASIFDGKDSVLSSHQAYDAGTTSLARSLAERLNGSLHLGPISRLLIDLNRSPTNRRSLFSVYSRKLEQSDREILLQKYYFPYRKMVEMEVDRLTARGVSVLHISVHSFSPEKDGKVRKADVGLLYDPGRSNEKVICASLVALFQEEIESLRVRRNYPYLGKTDGFTSFLRKKFSEKLYAGIEIETNMALLLSGNKKKKKVEEVLVKSISNVLKQRDFSNLTKFNR